MIDRYITATAGGRDAALGGAMNVDIADYPNIHRWFNAMASVPL